MQQPSSLTEIVDSYELPPNLRNKILKIATFQLTEAGITSFNGTYEHITGLVEKFQNYPNQISLDTPFSDEDARNLSSILGKEDPNLLNLVEGFNDENQKTFSAREAVDLLQSHLEPHLLTVLKTIVARAPSLPVPTDQEHAIYALPIIREKLQALHDRYQYKGTFRLLPKPIKHVDFDSSEIITFERRNFNGNPLAYFKEHEDFYQGFSRTQLSEIDPALYNTLLRTGQMNEAIPHSRIQRAERWQERFNGNPLAYFKEHSQRYAGLTRSELYKIDPELVDALYAFKQLNEAIPRVRKSPLGKSHSRQKFARFNGDPLAYFKSHYEEKYKGLSRSDLQREYNLLYHALRKKIN